MYHDLHKKTSARAKILALLKNEYPGVYPSGELQRIEFANEDGSVASPAIISRRLRELEEESLIAVRYGNKNHAEYRYLQEWERENYIPTSQRENEYSNNCWKNKEVVKEQKYKIEYRFNEAAGAMEEIKVYA